MLRVFLFYKIMFNTSKMNLREIGIAYIIHTCGGVDHQTLSDHFGASDTEINEVVTKMLEGEK